MSADDLRLDRRTIVATGEINGSAGGNAG